MSAPPPREPRTYTARDVGGMTWSDLASAALAAALHGDRDQFELLLAARNRKLEVLRPAIEAAGEALLAGERGGAVSDPVDLEAFACLLGRSGASPVSAEDLDRELKDRIRQSHPDRSRAADLAEEELRRRFLQLSNAHTALLLAIRKLLAERSGRLA